EKVWHPEIIPFRAVIIDRTIELSDVHFTMSPCRLDPAFEDLAERQPLRQSLRRRERNHRVREPVYRFELSSEFLDDAHEGQRVDDGHGVSQIPRPRYTTAAAAERRPRMAEPQQAQRRMHRAADAWIVTAVEKGERPMVLPFVERYPLLAVSACGRRLANPERGCR